MTQNLITQTASAADYASLDFSPLLTRQQALQFGGKTLADRCVLIRTAAIVISQTKDELLKGFGSDPDTLMQAIEDLQSMKDFIQSLDEVIDNATVRLLSVASTVIPDEEQLAA